MRALLYVGDGKVELTEALEVREPEAGEVLVRIVASGLCHSDLSVINGTIAWPAPSVLGHEGAGIVERVGAGVTAVKPGDHVVLNTLAACGTCEECRQNRPTRCVSTLGNRSTPFTLNGQPVGNFAATSTFAEFTIVKEPQAVPIDKSVPLDVACLIGCGVLTGVGAVLNRAEVTKGQTAAVFGIGGVGLNVIQGLKLSGASRIIAVDLLADKEALAREFGATDFLLAGEVDAGKKIREMLPAARAVFGSGGCDWAFECTGSPKALQSAVDSLGWGGTCVIVGMPPATAVLPLTIVQMCFVDRAIIGCRYGSSVPGKDIPRYIDLYRKKELKLDELVSKRYPIASYQQAFDDLHHGKLARGVLTF